MSEQVTAKPATAHQWITFAWEQWRSIGGEVSYLDINSTKDEAERMELKPQSEMECDPLGTLQYYAGWMAYYSSQSYMWRAIYEDLEDRYKLLTNKFIGEYEAKTPMRKLEAMARAYYSELVVAVNIAKTKYRKFQTEYETAETYRDTVSRMITLLEKDRRTGRYT